MSHNTKAVSFEICPAEDTSALAIEAYIRCAALQAAAAVVASCPDQTLRDWNKARSDATKETAAAFEDYLRRPR